MAAAVGQSGHDVSTDIVGWMWVVVYVGVCRLLYQAIGNTLPMR
jgi:hypothetical protein